MAMDTVLLQLARTLPHELLAEVVLQYVQVRTRRSDQTGPLRWGAEHEITDCRGNVIIVLKSSDLERKRISEAVAEAVIRLVVCTVCNDLLIEGEGTICMTCEAKRAKEVIQIVRDLQNDA